MEDDVEVELELEKQLALAHELFPTWPKSGLPPNWWQLNEEQTDTNFKLDNYFNGEGGDRFNEESNEAEMHLNGNRIGTTPTHI